MQWAVDSLGHMLRPYISVVSLGGSRTAPRLFSSQKKIEGLPSIFKLCSVQQWATFVVALGRRQQHAIDHVDHPIEGLNVGDDDIWVAIQFHQSTISLPFEVSCKSTPKDLPIHYNRVFCISSLNKWIKLSYLLPIASKTKPIYYIYSLPKQIYQLLISTNPLFLKSNQSTGFPFNDNTLVYHTIVYKSIANPLSFPLTPTQLFFVFNTSFKNYTGIPIWW